MSEPSIQQMILLASDVRRAGEYPGALRRAVGRGEMVQLSRGAYMQQSDWAALDDIEKYRCRVSAAILASRNNPTVSHASAAVLWGIPMIGALPKYVHVLSSPSTGTRLEGLIRRHRTGFPLLGVEELDGMNVTNFTRTVVEFAHMMPFVNAVVALDWALRPTTPRRPKPTVTRDELHSMIDELGIVRGRRQLDRALEFANPLSGSPGESISRVNIAVAGLPAPELQKEFSDARGRIAYVDFWWLDENLIGEFDGVEKYVLDEYTQGKSPAEVLIAEKRREDRLRATSAQPRMARWGWAIANSPDSLRELLVAAGLPEARDNNVAVFDELNRSRRAPTS